MAINPIEFLPINAEISGVVSSGSKSNADFGAWLDKQIGEVNDQIIEADNQLRQLAMGEADNLHQVMMSMEKAKINFNLILQVRNKVLEAYQDVMRMQL